MTASPHTPPAIELSYTRPAMSYVGGLWNRLVAGYTKDPAPFEQGGVLHQACQKHLPMLRAAVKLLTPPVAPPRAATITTPAAVTNLAGLTCSKDPEIAQVEAQFASLATEAQRDAYVSSLARGLLSTVDSTKPTTAPAAFPVKPTPPVKPTAPALSLDAQYDALATQEARQAFLKQHGASALKRR